MKAEIFVQYGSEPCIRWIREAMSARFGHTLSIDVNVVNSGSYASNLRAGNRYSQLVEASIPPELGLRIAAEHLDWMGARIYFLVYWPITTVMFDGSYRYSKGTVPLFSDQFPVLLPAVALRDRMLVVPAGHVNALANMGPGTSRGEEQLFSGLDEIDFTDRNSVHRALRRTLDVISNQLRTELGAWASLLPPGAVPDMEAAAQSLEVDAGILRSLITDQIEQVRRQYERVECVLESTSFPVRRWTRTALRIHNVSGGNLNQVAVSFDGPVEIRPSKLIVDVPHGCSSETLISVRPIDPGQFPIEISLVEKNNAVISEWIPPKYVWLDVSD